MSRRVLTAVSVIALAAASPVLARAAQARPSAAEGTLDDALFALSRRTGVEILFDQQALKRISAPSISQPLPPEAALQRLLDGTGLVARRLTMGPYIVEPAQAAALERQDVPVSEILVVGRRSQNADIRRMETDIQPYRVASGEHVLRADRDNLDQYFASRVPANTTAVSPSQGDAGETNSNISLRGLAPHLTLVLVDGRRMPSMPLALTDLGQPDLNPIPLHAIERVETLTGAVGGIHGFDAAAGVVNVVLARGGTGAALHVSGGQTTRGDARQARLEGRIGLDANHGRTEAMVFVSATRAEPLLNRQRDFVLDDLLQSSPIHPYLLLERRWSPNAIVLLDRTGQPLRFKAARGGDTLTAANTVLPTGLSGEPGEIAALLRQNAGQYALGTSGSVGGDLTSTPRTASVIANLRHRFDSGVETYVDAIALWNRGYFREPQRGVAFSLAASSANNPFTREVFAILPSGTAIDESRAGFETARYLAGVVAPLPHGWRGTGEIAKGSARYDFDVISHRYNLPSTVNPFAAWSSIQAILDSSRKTTRTKGWLENDFTNASVRAAGPLFQSRAGPVTLSLLAEYLVQDMPEGHDFALAAQRVSTRSLHGELRAPLFGRKAPLPLLRGLETQLAVRHDRRVNNFARHRFQPQSERLRLALDETALTVGAKVAPSDGLILRGSYAYSAVPPDPWSFVEDGAGLADLADPKRGRTFSGKVPRRWGGNPDLELVRVKTISLGAILAPLGPRGPRLTIDYAHIGVANDIYRPQNNRILVYEDFWPQRVKRGPLTDEDRAKGYQAGPILEIDERWDNSSPIEVDTVDIGLEWRRPWLGGALRVYGDATYFPSFYVVTPLERGENLVDRFRLPLSRRANLGADWTRGAVSVSLNVQRFGSYRITPEARNHAPEALDAAAEVQGSKRVPSQTYIDLHLSWRGMLRNNGVQVDLGVVNLFDKAPPRESAVAISYLNTSDNPAYSRYGDARQRRLVLGVSAAF